MIERPTSVTVLGIIGVALAGMGILGGIGTIVSPYLHIDLGAALPKSLEEDGLYRWTSLVSVCAGLLIAGLLLAGSIGSLSLRGWRRKGMMVYAVLALVQLGYGTVFNMVYVFPWIVAATPAASQPADAEAMMMGGYIVGGGVFVLGAIFPVCVLIFYSRGKVVDAFRGLYRPVLKGVGEVLGEKGPESPFY